MTYYFFHIKIDTPFHKGHASGVLGFYEQQAPTPVDALQRIKEQVHAKYPNLKISDLEVTQFNNVA